MCAAQPADPTKSMCRFPAEGKTLVPFREWVQEDYSRITCSRCMGNISFYWGEDQLKYGKAAYKAKKYAQELER